MTPLRFRAWDTVCLQMETEGGFIKIDGHGNWSVYVEDGEDSHWDDATNNDGNWIIMQSTGLTDKSGKEIFCGDLLAEGNRHSENYIAYEVFWHDNDCADSHIGWQMNRTHFQGNIAGGSIWRKMLPKHTKEMEIIGNIYENPELLSPSSK